MFSHVSFYKDMVLIDCGIVDSGDVIDADGRTSM